MKYRVTLIVDATVSVEVEADNKEQALSRAYAQAETPVLCHQCNEGIELNDVVPHSDDLDRVEEL